MVQRPNLGQAQNVRLVPAQRILGRIFEHVVGELVGRIELVARDGAKRGEIAFRGCLLRRIIFVGDAVAEAVGIAQVAAEDGVQRIALQRGFVAGLEQLEQPVMRALFGCRLSDRLGGRRDRCRLRRGRRRAGGERRHGRAEEKNGEPVLHDLTFIR